ncbi:uncharacterized protein LOC128549555 [Mercenaria mercenaria]|uniref:uncharacterized protein LOC128549555 n=1 Tax=Mercenaria mercenaria TaxID=6596 RepID=UPI00234F5322|nr:uncharacterized protein LOC128549555 [Mercenaria mercenaria]
MQDTLYVPNFDENLGFWNLNDNLQKQSAPSAQIHYNGSHHWLMSYQISENEPVCILDSLKSQRTLNNSLAIQLSQIYDNHKDSLKALIPEIQRQENSSDCGVFAVAYLTELLMTNFTVDVSTIRFDISKMRAHLYECISKCSFSAFPKINKMPKMPCKDARVQTVRLYCTRKLPDIVEDMVKCDNKKCRHKWYHKKCVGFVETVRGKTWLCHFCSW